MAMKSNVARNTTFTKNSEGTHSTREYNILHYAIIIFFLSHNLSQDKISHQNNKE